MHEAKTQLSRLLEAVEAGEDVVIARAGTPVARLVPFEEQARQPGRLEGRVRMAPDFDDPLPSDIATPFGSDEQ